MKAFLITTIIIHFLAFFDSVGNRLWVESIACAAWIIWAGILLKGMMG